MIDELRVLVNIGGHPNTDVLKVGYIISKQEKLLIDEGYFILLIRTVNGKYEDDPSKVSIRIWKNDIKKILPLLKNQTEIFIRGTPITQDDLDYRKKSGPEGRVNTDILKITAILTIIKNEKTWCFDVEITKRNNSHAKIRIPKWNLIYGIEKALKNAPFE